MKDPYHVSSYHYDLPEELIAKYPCTSRDHSRLLVVNRLYGTFSEYRFYELQNLLHKGDSLVFNNTKVIPAKLYGQRLSGGKTEVLLVRNRSITTWEVMAKPGKRLRLGSIIEFGPDLSCEVIEILDDGQRVIKFHCDGDLEQLLNHYGQMPLPQYMEREENPNIDPTRYQTVYAQEKGAIAAPTAGLHFTPELLDALTIRGVDQTYLTLHVGLGTFKPVKVEDIRKHQMHKERVIISEEIARKLNQKSFGRRICVGTTTCRALESAAQNGKIQSGDFETNIFIYPGYQFKYIDHLLTNFHLPGSTLLMLVSAFGGYDLIMEAYHYAVKNKFRFFSYGDAMLII